MIYDAIVIGAGQAGLAAGYHLQQARLRFLILEANDEPVGSWPQFPDSLRLNSPARFSALPGFAFPGHPDRYPTRDEVVEYLHMYAAHFTLQVKTRTRVVTVERSAPLYRVVTHGQGSYLARAVVAATGFFGHPHVPELPGQAAYQGKLVHVATYRRPEAFRGQRIVIVGGGNAAVRIGVELADVAQVTLATRSPIRYLPQRLLGRDIHVWLRLSGLDGTKWMQDRSTPVYANEAFRRALAAGRPDRKPMFQRLTADGVLWSDGSHEGVDTVMLATGYRPNLPYLASLGVLDDGGHVRQQQGLSTTLPGLGYVGLLRQRTSASTTLRGVGPDAKHVIDQLHAYSRRPGRWCGMLPCPGTGLQAA